MDADEALMPSSSADTGLPRSAVTKLIKDVTPPHLKCSPEAQLLLLECLNEFMQMLTTEANEGCTRQNKNTISDGHVIDALKALGFDRYVAAFQTTGGVPQDPKAALRAEKKRKRKAQQSDLSPEELLRMQQELFAGARQRMEADRSTSHADEPGPVKPE